MTWTVEKHRRVHKALKSLPKNIRYALDFLVSEIQFKGPMRGDWPNYGKLGRNRHHCHLKKGHPTYVAVWEEDATGIKLIEVTYVGTHEKAPY